MLLTYTSLAQYGLFLGIGLILFGWIEKKKQISLLGQLVFVLLGFYALWIILSHQIVAPVVQNTGIPKEIKIRSFFTSLLIGGGIGLITILLNYFNLRLKKISLVILLLYGLLLFFIVYHLQQA